MMRFAYLVAAHEKSEQLSKLLDQLLLPENDDFVVLHLDAKSPLWKKHRSEFSSHRSGRVHVIQAPTSVFWGHESQVEAIRLLLTEALKRDFTLAHLISGVDWPVIRRDDMVAAVSRYDDAIPAFIEIEETHDQHRMQNYWIRDYLRGKFSNEFLSYHAGRFSAFVMRQFNGLCQKFIGERPQPFGPWAKGSSWWSLPQDIASATVEAMDRNATRLRFTNCADEHFIQTFVHANHSDRIAPYQRFILWPPEAWNPVTLGTSHIPEIKASDAWFARKIDMEKDDAVIRAFAQF